MRDHLQRVLDFAAAKEREAEAFYKEWGQKVSDLKVRALLAELAAADNGHWQILRHVVPHDVLSSAAMAPTSSEIAQWLVEVPIATRATLHEAMTAAIHRKAAAAVLYEWLERFGGETGPLLQSLKSDELRHKNLLETAFASEA